MFDSKKILSLEYVLRIVFTVSTINLLTRAFFMNIDYQDLWFLSNIEIDFLLFIGTYTLLFLYEKRVENLLIYSIIGRLVIFLTPNFKYTYFLGRSMDQQFQYILSNEIIYSGYINSISTIPPTKYYTESPLFHIAISIFSNITGLNIINAFKYFPLILNILYPLYFYSIINKMSTKNDNYLKFTLLLSSIPFSRSRSFIVTGVMFIFPLLLGIINQYINLFNEKKRVDYILFIFIIIGSTMSHPIETLQFLLILLTTSVVINIINRFEKTYLIRQVMGGVLFIAGWIFLRESQFDYLRFFFTDNNNVNTVTSTGTLLLRTSIFSTVKVFFSFYGTYVLYSSLLLISVYYLYNEYKEKNGLKNEYEFLLIFLFVVLGFTFFGYIISPGFGFHNRLFRNYYFVAILLSGYFLNHIPENMGNKVLPLIAVLAIITSGVQLFSHPYLITSASEVFSVNEDIPMVYKGETNSIYQREMIQHTYEHVESRIACDRVTRNQLIGITDDQYFDKYVIWHYPPASIIYTYIPVKEYDVFLIHMPGISGSFEERADIRDDVTVMNQVYNPNLDLVYSNAQSFVLYNKYH